MIDIYLRENNKVCLVNEININNGINMKTTVIAEIGWNFMGDMALAQKMIRSSKESGANIAKFQYWNPDNLKRGPWDFDGRIDIYKAAALDAKKIKQLISICGDTDINFLISAFNKTDAKFLVDIGVNNIKIPSHEVANVRLHEFAAVNFERVYVSLGAGIESEIERACDIYNTAGRVDWVGMHCVSSYPCSTDQANLPRLNYLRTRCETLGYSDHTTDVITPALSLAFGVSVLEKHFTVDKNLPGRDNKFALDPKEFTQMVDNIRLAEQSLVNHGSGPREIEADTMNNYRGRWGE